MKLGNRGGDRHRHVHDRTKRGDENTREQKTRDVDFRVLPDIRQRLHIINVQPRYVRQRAERPRHRTRDEHPDDSAEHSAYSFHRPAADKVDAHDGDENHRGCRREKGRYANIDQRKEKEEQAGECEKQTCRR